jgi:hypothetical protein
MTTPRIESQIQPGLFFWAEQDPGAVPCWIVYSQAKGFPATEACDDWFANKADAEAIAEQLAKGDPTE